MKNLFKLTNKKEKNLIFKYQNKPNLNNHSVYPLTEENIAILNNIYPYNNSVKYFLLYDYLDNSLSYKSKI